MFTHATNAALDIDVLLPTGEFTEGSVIDAVVRGVAGREIVTTGGELALIKTVTYGHRQGNPYGGFYTVPALSTEVVTRQALRTGIRYATGEPLFEAVTLTIPSSGPGSVTTDLIRIEWTVRAHLQLEGHSDVDAGRVIVVLSRSADRASVVDSSPVIQDRQSAHLTCQNLSSRRLIPGVPITGILTLTPQRRVSARSVRVELVLRQQVHHIPWIGDDPTHNPSRGQEIDTVLATVGLGEKVRLDPGQPSRFPFSVAVPAQVPSPSIHTPEFTVSWILRGVLDRALHQDPTVEIELHGVTTAE